VLDPKTTIPPRTTAIAPIIVTGSNPISPSVIANNDIPPPAMASFEITISLRQPLCEFSNFFDMTFEPYYLIT
jgi:hypothetical protein